MNYFCILGWDFILISLFFYEEEEDILVYHLMHFSCRYLFFPCFLQCFEFIMCNDLICDFGVLYFLKVLWPVCFLVKCCNWFSLLGDFNFLCFRAVEISCSRMEASVILPILKKKLAFLSGTVCFPQSVPFCIIWMGFLVCFLLFIGCL